MSYLATIKRSGNTSADTDFIKRLECSMPTLEIGLDRDSDDEYDYGTYHNEDYMIEIGEYVIQCELYVCEELRELPRSGYLDPPDFVSSLDVTITNLQVLIEGIQISLSKDDEEALKKLINDRIVTY